MTNDEIGYEARPGTTATSATDGKQKNKALARIRMFFLDLLEFWRDRRKPIVYKVNDQPGMFVCVGTDGELFTNTINCGTLLTPPAWYGLFLNKHMKRDHNAEPMMLGDALFLADLYGQLNEETKRRWIISPMPKQANDQVKGERAK